MIDRWMYEFFSGRPPQLPQAKLHVEWTNNIGLIAYIGLSPLADAETKIPHMTRSMEDVILLAAKRGAIHA